MREIVINKCFGGFGLSYDGVMEYATNKGIKLYAYVDKRNPDGSLMGFDKKERFEPYTKQADAFLIYYSTKPLKNGKNDNDSYFSCSDIDRDDVDLVRAVRKLKKKANARFANLKIIKIPTDVEFEVDEYDGLESIHEKHRSWQ